MQPQSPYPNGQSPQPGVPGQPYGPPQGQYNAPYGPPQPGQPYFQPNPGEPMAQPPAAQFPQAQIPGQPQQYGPNHPAYRPPVPAYQPPANYRPQPAHHDPPPPPPEPSTPYDFFMKQQKPGIGKKTLIPPAKANNKAFRIGLVAGGIVLLLIIASVVQAMLPKDTTGQQLLEIAQTQTELARVADLGSRSKTTDMRFFAVNSSLTINTDRLAMLNFMKKNGFKYKDKDLSMKRDSKTDATLKSATSSSTYDDTFKTLYVGQLNDYGRLLQQRLNITNGPNEREMLTNDIEHIKLLLEQADQKN